MAHSSTSRFGEFTEKLRGYALLPCLICDGSCFTYGELLDEIECWRSHLDCRGVAAGTSVAIRADYSLHAIAALLALLERRAIVALIPFDGDVERYVVDAHAAALITFDSDGSWRWCDAADYEDHELLKRLRNSGKGGVVVFTSGSTGAPKAALQSLESFLYKFSRPGRQMRTLAFLLLDHIAGLDTLFYTLANGGAIIVTRRRDPLEVLNLIESHRIEVLPTSPSFLRLLCATKEERQRDLSSLKIITYGSEVMDAATLSRVNARFPNVQISQKYGTTETGSPRSVSRSSDSLWIKFKGDGVETKVIDDVLYLKSEGMILGYLNAESPIDAAGWYRTGDLVDVEGEWIRFRGRTGDVIKVGGEKVALAEVEQTILELDFVREAIVSGEPHALMGSVVAARVALAVPDMHCRDAAGLIRAHCKQRLGAHKTPVRIVFATDDFATARQKLRRGRPSN